MSRRVMRDGAAETSTSRRGDRPQLVLPPQIWTVEGAGRLGNRKGGRGVLRPSSQPARD